MYFNKKNPKKCNSCGRINLEHRTSCLWCQSSDLTEIKRTNPATDEEWELTTKYERELTYLIRQIFEEVKPKERDLPKLCKE